MIRNMILLIIGAIISVFISKYYEISTLEFKEGFKEQYLNLSDSSLKDLSIQYKNRKIDNVSVYQVGIYNRTFKDLENVKIYFTLKSKNGERIPNIINKELISTTSKSPFNILEIDQKEKDVYVYNIKVLKRTTKDNFYLAKFVFEGSQVPNITVSVPDNIGINIKEYGLSFEEYAYLFLIGCIIIGIVIFFRLLDSFSMNRHWDEQRIPQLRELLSRMKGYVDEKTAEIIVLKYAQEYKPKKGYFHRKFTQIINSLK